jgi:SET and MYND domain-containing protein
MWGPGSSGPVAIQVGYTPGAGRGVFAVRDIAVGDLTHTADPVVAHPALASLQKVGSTSSSELHFSAVSYFLLCCRV